MQQYSPDDGIEQMTDHPDKIPAETIGQLAMQPTDDLASETEFSEELAAKFVRSARKMLGLNPHEIPDSDDVRELAELEQDDDSSDDSPSTESVAVDDLSAGPETEDTSVGALVEQVNTNRQTVSDAASVVVFAGGGGGNSLTNHDDETLVAERFNEVGLEQYDELVVVEGERGLLAGSRAVVRHLEQADDALTPDGAQKVSVTGNSGDDFASAKVEAMRHADAAIVLLPGPYAARVLSLVMDNREQYPALDADELALQVPDREDGGSDDDADRGSDGELDEPSIDDDIGSASADDLDWSSTQSAEADD